MKTTRALLALLSVLVLLAFAAATTAAKSSSFEASLLPGSDCPFCGNCSNHNTASRALIMKVNWTRHDYAWGFQGEVLKMYTGSNTQRAVGVPPQNTNSPCFTTWLIGQPYIVAMVYTGEQPPVKFQPASPDAPECFFISLDQCQYFKLESLLTQLSRRSLASTCRRSCLYTSSGHTLLYLLPYFYPLITQICSYSFDDTSSSLHIDA